MAENAKQEEAEKQAFIQKESNILCEPKEDAPEDVVAYIVERLDSQLGYVCTAIDSQDVKGYFLILLSIVDIAQQL